jgi:hypothetical protein
MSDDAASSNSQLDILWDHSIENMLANWCDEAKCFEWMHSESHSSYDMKAKSLVIASNVVTAIAGLSNVIAGGYEINGFQLAWAFGSLSIVISILNMIQEKMAYSTLAAYFRQYSTTWGIIRRKIEEELALPATSRKNCGTFLQSIRQDINQVSLAGNGILPVYIKKACFERFNKVPNFEVPEICGELSHTLIYKPLDTPIVSATIPLLQQKVSITIPPVNQTKK